MKKTITKLLLIFVGLISTESFAQMIYSNENVEVHKLDKKLFLLKENTRFTANILALTSEDGILLMDTGFGDVSDDLADAVNFLGKKVRVIINSHHHGDHTGANAAFGNRVKIIGHAACSDELHPEWDDFIGIKDEYSLKFSGRELSCISFPFGHSECDIIVHIPDMKIAYLGDLYLSESFPLVVIEAGSKAQKVVNNLKEIHALLPDDTRLFSGHGRETNMSELETYINMLETTIELVKAEMKNGKDLDEIKDSDLLKDFAQWGKFFTFITQETWIEQIYLSYE